MRTLPEIIERFTFRSEPHPADGEIEISINWERIANEWAIEQLNQYSDCLLENMNNDKLVSETVIKGALTEFLADL